LPLYPYRCTECGHRFEKIQKFNSKPEKKCPECGGKLERPLTAPGLQFKGAGWYVNDYASKSPAPAEKTGGDSTSTETKKSSESAEKPASTGEKSAPASPAPAKPSATTTKADS